MNFKSQAGLILVALFIILGLITFAALPIIQSSDDFSMTTFSSNQEFIEYLENSDSYSGYFGSIQTLGGDVMVSAMRDSFAMPAAVSSGTELSSEPERVSETNVQVQGIDEPDIIKTDGKEIYFSRNGFRSFWGGLYAPYYSQSSTEVIKSFPVENMTEENSIGKSGDLLLYEGNLVIFSYEDITGYNVSNPLNISKTWELKLNNSYVVTSRLYNGKIYLITQKSINRYNPCPIIPISIDGIARTVYCSDIFHPTYPVSVDVNYYAMIINPNTGDVENSISFVGTSGQSNVYMSNNAIYVTYPQYESSFDIYYGLILESTDIFPSGLIQRIRSVANLAISDRAKETELGVIIEEYMTGLNSDQALELSNKLVNKTTAYFESHKRDFTKTGIVKIDLNLKIQSNAIFPGTLLNQFSMDEYEGNLRIATTVRAYNTWNTIGSENDVYVFDSNMNQIGSILGLGVDERIYSARFIADKGYLVTFRQTDPFYVLDLSIPTNPQVKGELKIPGYSSYLHPISDDLILGIGKEDQYMKASLFDVSDPTNPLEISKYTLSEYWSEALNNHHAFLLDKEHEIFFLPGSQGGHILTYAGNSLDLIKSVGEYGVKRAIYIDDYLYIIWDDQIRVFDENTWEEINSLELEYEEIPTILEPMIDEEFI